jgi:hypothetical protein
MLVLVVVEVWLIPLNKKNIPGQGRHKSHYAEAQVPLWGKFAKNQIFVSAYKISSLSKQFQVRV